MEKKYEARVGKYVMALEMCRIPENRGILYAEWEKEINADGGDLTDEGKLENDIFDAMLEDEYQEVWDWFFKLREENEEEKI